MLNFCSNEEQQCRLLVYIVVFSDHLTQTNQSMGFAFILHGLIKQVSLPALQYIRVNLGVFLRALVSDPYTA